MGYSRNLVADAHVRSSIIVEFDVTCYHIPCMHYIIELSFPVNDFGLYNTIYTLSNCIIRRFIVLCHADCYMVLLQYRNLLVTAVLNSTVRVMYKSVKVIRTFHFYSLGYSSIQGTDSNRDSQSISQFPTYNFV